MGRVGRRRRAMVALVVVAAIAPATSASVLAAGVDGGRTVGTGPAEVSTVGLTQRFAALPDRPGLVRATHRFDIPDAVERLQTSVPADATVIEARGGFSHDGGTTYVWEDGSETASIVYRLPVNETGTASGPEGADGEYRYVDVGEWGLFSRPPAPIDVTYYGSGIDFDRRTAVDGAGAAGDWLVFVGDATIHQREANGQSFRLAVPAAADLAEQPGDVLDAVIGAAGTLQVGARDDTVLMVVAPTTVDWGVEGLQVGESDLYVTADERLDEARNTWLHEYVHTRQSFELTPETRWLTEATATYYAALLTLRQERIPFAEFRDALDRGTRRADDDTVLSRPETWAEGSDYLKGALVAGDLDRRIRVDTENGRSLQRVHRRLNERSDAVDGAEFVDLVTEVSSAAVGEAADRYTRTTAMPEPWDLDTHQDVFGELPARISYDLPDGDGTNYRIAGTYRNITTGESPFVLVPGERLGVELTVTNVGGTIGSYGIDYGLVGGETQRLEGALEGGDAVVEPIWIPVDSTGDATLRIGEFERSVIVVEPATLEIGRIDLNRSTVPPDGVVGVSVELRNPATHPGERTVQVSLDGEPAASRTVHLRGSETRTVSIPVRVGGPGERRLAVGDATRTVTVATPAPAERTETPAGTAGGSGPGLGVLGVSAVLCLAGFLAARRV